MLDLQYLATLLEREPAALNAPVEGFEVRGKRFAPWPEASLMGVVNLSADSWYRESVVLNVEAAVRRGRRLMAEGAAIIDVGAESTVLNAQRVEAAVQGSKLVPVIEELAGEGGIVSVESYDATVVEVSLRAGAAIVNMTAGRNTEAIYRLAAEHGAAVVICYIQDAENARLAGDFKLAADHTAVLYDYFARETELARKCGVAGCWVDPGLGFYYKNLSDSAQRVRYQIETFLNAYRLRRLGVPVCQALPHAFEYFEEEVRSAEPFFGVMALMARTDLLRTHEVAKVRGVLRAMGVVQ